MPQHLEKINVLRGVAIMLVFGYHSLLVVFGQYEIYDYSPTGLWIDFARYAPGRVVLGLTPWGLGAQGVTLFLVISGFLIHWGWLKSGATFRPGEFFNKRFWRIYPPYLAAVAVFGLALGTGGWFSLLTHLTLTHNFFERSFFTINPSFWSLALEMQLYLLYPVLLLLRRWLGGMGRATLAVGAVAGLSMALEIGLQTRSPTLWLSALNLWIVWALGAYFGERLFRGERLFWRGGAWLVGAYALLTLSALTPVYALLGRVLFSLFFIGLLDWYLHRPTPAAPSAVGRALAGLTARVGLYSYSIYLFHQPYLDKVIRFLSFGHSNRLVQALAVAGAFVLVFAVARVTYHWLEVPAIRWGRQLYARWQAPGPVAARV
jgi:peptidoglycan/LPS O-acetylase OafA/YrhL